MKKEYIIIFSLLFAGGSLYTTLDWRQYHIIFVIVATTMIYALGLLKQINISRFDKKTLRLFLLFIIASIISGFIHRSVTLIGGALLLLYIYGSVVILFPNMIRSGYYGKKILSLTLIISHLPMILLPLIFYDFRTTSYSGMFYNSNSFGTIVATLAIVPLSKIAFEADVYFSLKRVNRESLIKNMFLFLVIFILVIYSSSRTSFLGILTLLVLLMSIISKRIFKDYKVNTMLFKKAIFVISLVTVVIIVAYNFTFFGSIIQNNIFDKFSQKADNIFDDRPWIKAINEMKAFGHGRDYFLQIGVGAHNTFISILGQYGYIPLLFFILFFIRTFTQSLKNVTYEFEDRNKYLPLFGITIFILLSMGEGMMLKTSMFVAFATIGLLSIAKSKLN